MLASVSWLIDVQVTPREVGPGISRQANFGSFWSAFILLFRGLTGESINVSGTIAVCFVDNFVFISWLFRYVCNVHTTLTSTT